ncbi:MAG: ABC transporter substrate-binding protein [Actinomycetaceae bacterium]
MAGTRTRRRYAATAVALAAASVLAACGGDGDDDLAPPDDSAPGETTSDAPPETASESASEAPTAPGPDVPADEVPLPELEGYADLSGQAVEIATSWSGDRLATFERVLAAFEEATGADVQHLGAGGDPTTALTESVEDGRPPDVALVRDPGLLQDLATDGAIVPLADETVAAVQESYGPAWVELGTHDDELYGVWFEAESKSTVWYDTALYEEAGVEEPRTWDEFVAAIGTLSAAGTPALSVGVDIGWPLTDWFENVYLASAGPEMYDRLADHEIPWTDPSVVEALEMLAEVWGDEDLLLPGGPSRTYPEAVSSVFGDPPQAATMVGGDYVRGAIIGQTDSVLGEDAAFYGWPGVDGPSRSVVGSASGVVAFDDEEGTQELVRYLASPEAADLWIRLGGSTSPNADADLDLYTDPAARAVAEHLSGAEVFRVDLSDQVHSSFGASTAQGMWPILIDFFTDPSDPEATAQELEDAAATGDANARIEDEDAEDAED